jgi:stage II sporulation protein GA (sporulation sigma-E factor processing peptidase)
MKFLASLVFIQIAFQPPTVKSMLQFTAAYYIACFVTGGAITGWYYYRQSFVSALFQPINSFLAWKDVLGGGILALCFLLAVKSSFISNLLHKSIEYQVEVLYKERIVTFTAILDTGNSLYSASRSPVIVAEFQAIRQLLSQEATDFFLLRSSAEWLEDIYLCEDKEWLARLQIIPFRGLGGENVLIGFRPDVVHVQVKDSTIETSEVIIGVYAGSLSANNRYTALLHPAILQCSVHKEVKRCVSLV